MNRSSFQPGPLADVAVESDAGRWTLVFVRDVNHRPDAVWAALTDSARLDLRVGGGSTAPTYPNASWFVGVVRRRRGARSNGHARERIHADETNSKSGDRTVAAVDVVLVRWPQEAERRGHLEQDRVPRLLLVSDGAAPPLVEDPLEDWVRVPAQELDVRARLETLSSRHRRSSPSRPTIDDDGVLRSNGSWTSLPPVEARLTAALLDRYGAVVSRDSLGRAGWPDGAPGRNALDVHVLRLRRRLSSIGLVIRTVRSRGYLLEAQDMRQQSVGQA